MVRMQSKDHLRTEHFNLRKHSCTIEYATPNTVGPLYKGHIGTLIPVLITEVSSILRSLYTLQYYTGTQIRVPITEVSTFQRFVIERSHCTVKLTTGPPTTHQYYDLYRHSKQDMYNWTTCRHACSLFASNSATTSGIIEL